MYQNYGTSSLFYFKLNTSKHQKVIKHFRSDSNIITISKKIVANVSDKAIITLNVRVWENSWKTNLEILEKFIYNF